MFTSLALIGSGVLLLVACRTRLASFVGTWSISLVFMIAIVPAIGFAIMVDRSEARPETALVMFAGTCALLSGFGLVGPATRRPPVPGGFMSRPMDARWLRRCMILVGSSAIVQMLGVGLPALSSNPELARWEAGDGFLLGVPGRLASIGGDLVIAIGVCSWPSMSPRQRRGLLVFGGVVVAYTAGLGFRSSLLELTIYVSLVFCFSRATRLTVSSSGARGIVVLLPALLVFGYLSTAYTSDVARAQSDGGLVSAFAERLTVGSARSGVVLLESEPYQLGYTGHPGPPVVSSDAGTLLGSYIGRAPDQNRLNERLSARVAGADPTVLVRSAIAPATPGLVAVVLYSFGSFAGLLILVAIGFGFRKGASLLPKAPVTPRLLVGVSVVYMYCQLTLKGNVEYQVLNVLPIALVLFVLALIPQGGRRDGNDSMATSRTPIATFRG